VRLYAVYIYSVKCVVESRGCGGVAGRKRHALVDSDELNKDTCRLSGAKDEHSELLTEASSTACRQQGRRRRLAATSRYQQCHRGQCEYKELWVFKAHEQHMIISKEPSIIHNKKNLTGISGRDSAVMSTQQRMIVPLPSRI